MAITWGKPAKVEDSALLRAHTAEHLKRLEQEIDFDADTPHLPGISDFARASAGAGLEAMRAARAGETVFSLMRPPGHHATQNRAMGFCYLSNMAIAVVAARLPAQSESRSMILMFTMATGRRPFCCISRTQLSFRSINSPAIRAPAGGMSGTTVSIIRSRP